MDKYEYKLKTEEMLELMEDGEYRKAAAAADLIDWKRVRNAGMLMNVSDIYEKTKEPCPSAHPSAAEQVLAGAARSPFSASAGTKV